MKTLFLHSLILLLPLILAQNTAETQPVTETTTTTSIQTTLTTPSSTTPSWISIIPNYLQATIWCRSTNSLGRFPAVDQTTNNVLSGYFYCYIYNGTISGQYYECPGRTVFNSTLQLCSPGSANNYL